MSKLSVFNPNNQPIESLPVIYGFNNGGSPGWYSALDINNKKADDAEAAKAACAL